MYVSWDLLLVREVYEKLDTLAATVLKLLELVIKKKLFIIQCSELLQVTLLIFFTKKLILLIYLLCTKNFSYSEIIIDILKILFIKH